MEGQMIGAPVMLQLGDFQFGIQTAAFQELGRIGLWRWVEQDLFGKAPALQFTGPGSETITLPGVIFPEWRGGFGQVEAMRQLAAGGKPLPLVDGDGSSLGRWVIERVEETRTVFGAGSKARRIEFALDLRQFAAADPGGLIAAVAELVGPASLVAIQTVSIPAGATTIADRTKGLAASVSSGAAAASGALARAADQVQQRVAPFASIARDSLGAVNRSLGVVSELQGVANAALSSLGIRPIEVNALLQAENLSARADRALVRATSASEVLRTSSDNLARLSGVTPAATRAMQEAQAAADRAVNFTRQTAAQAAMVKG